MEPPAGKKFRALWLIAVIGIAIVLGVGAYLFYFDTYHFAVVQPGVLYRMGLRSKREAQNAIERVHPRAVVSLVTDAEMDDATKGDFRGELTLLKKDHIMLYRLPMGENQFPTSQQMDQFIKIVTDPRNQPVIVHCAQGVVRTGMMVAVYDQRVLGYNRDRALQSVRIFGKGQARADRVDAFIDRCYRSFPSTALAHWK